MRNTEQFNVKSDNAKPETQKKKSSPAKKMLIASGLLIVVALAQYLIFDITGVGARQNLRMIDTGIGVSYGFDMHANFYSPGAQNFFFGTRDGMQNISSTGDVRWQQGFNMIQPIMVGRGDMVAVGESEGRRIYVFNMNGLMYIANLQHPVLYFTVNQTGYLSVIMRTDIGYEIQVFNPNNPGDPNYGYRAPINDANVFPWSVDVSECGTYIAKALMDVDTLILSRLTFSYVRRVDSRGLPDGLFASYSFPNEFIFRTRFTGCGRVIAVTDHQILGFEAGSGTQGPLWNIPLYNRLDKIHIGESSFAYVTGDPFLNQPEAENPGVLRIYNFDGQLTGTYDLGRRATHLNMGFNTVVVGIGRTFYALNNHGIQLWNYSAIYDVQDMFFLDNTDTVLLAGSTRASVMRRLRVTEN